MIRSAGEVLSGLGIHLRNYAEGGHKVLCPKCSHTRKNKRDPCLSVTIDEKGVLYCCHNSCGFEGGEFYDREAGDRGYSKPADQRSHTRRQEAKARAFYR